MNLNEIDFENIGAWPLALRVTATALVLAAVLGGGYYFDFLGNDSYHYSNEMFFSTGRAALKFFLKFIFS